MSGEQIQVEPSKVIESLLRQIAEQSVKIATLEAYIGQLTSNAAEQADSGDK
jgi:hypothetical protein